MDNGLKRPKHVERRPSGGSYLYYWHPRIPLGVHGETLEEMFAEAERLNATLPDGGRIRQRHKGRPVAEIIVDRPPTTGGGAKEIRCRQMPSGCIECYSHRKQSQGYSQAYIGGRLVLLHRYAYEAVRGPIPDGYDIHHRCKNRGCLNVEHMDLLTTSEHMTLENLLRHQRRADDDAPIPRIVTNLRPARSQTMAPLVPAPTSNGAVT